VEMTSYITCFFSTGLMLKCRHFLTRLVFSFGCSVYLLEDVNGITDVYVIQMLISS
jgi:hypothetical protein